MNDRKRISDELRPYVDREEGEALDRIAWRLEETDPEPPSAAFRSELRSHLVELQGRQIRTGRPHRAGVRFGSTPCTTRCQSMVGLRHNYVCGLTNYFSVSAVSIPQDAKLACQPKRGWSGPGACGAGRPLP